MSTDTPLLCVDQFPFRWGDMDALGHLNNTLYFRFFEEARVRWLSQNGWAVATQAAEGAILAATSCQFRRPLVYPGDLQVETRVLRIGEKSFTLGYRLTRVDDPETTAAEGDSVIVWCHYESGESRRLPDRLRAQLTGTIV